MNAEKMRIGIYEMKLIILLLAASHAFGATQQSPSYIANTFEDSFAGLHTIARDEQTGNIYVGSINSIYELSNTLVILRKVNTGPRDDSPKCAAPSLPCPDKRVSTDVVVKAMVIDSSDGRLIVCFNLYQGICERRTLNDLNSVDSPSYIAVVPNDVSSSTVLLIAPGITKAQEQRDVLYVAAERSVLAYRNYQDDVFPLSTRYLNNFALSYVDTFKKSRIQVNSYDWGNSMRIRYITGFSYDGFSYFIAVQKAHTSAKNYITKLIRVCQRDNYGFRSYVEVPLECTKSDTTYNIARAAVAAQSGHELNYDSAKALFVLFSTSKTALHTSEPSDMSAMCVYNMWDIQSKFTFNIRQCFVGSGYTGPNHLTKPMRCRKFAHNLFPIGDDYCGEFDTNFPIGSNSWPITSTAVITWNTAVTAVAVTSTLSYNVAFVGTQNGHIKKVVVETSVSATQYDEIPVDVGNPINPNLLFEGHDNYLYVTTIKKVTQIKVEECSKYKSCSECVIKTKDPYCGWCSLESKCSVSGQCANAEQPMHWLSYNKGQCPEITEVFPSQIQIENAETNLMLNIRNLPSQSEGTWHCAFYPIAVSSPLIQQATKNKAGVTCSTPPRTKLPNIPSGSDHITMPLAVRRNGQDLVATNFSFFSCALHSSCTACTKSLFPCTWCVRQHICTNDRESCGSDEIVTGNNVRGHSERSGPYRCPRIILDRDEFLVPSGNDESIFVNAKNLLSFQDNFRFVFNMSGGNMVHRNARLANSTIKCDSPVHFENIASIPSLLVPFEVTWGTKRLSLDNPKNINVKVYNCPEMALVDDTANCGNCLTLDSSYHCVWCQQTSSCTLQSQCQANWLLPSNHCPNPEIRSIHPLSGPSIGGTKLTIRGINLGKEFNDIYNGVEVGSIPCTVIEDEYVKTSKIVCITGQVVGNASNTLSLQVSVKIGNQYTTTSVARFHYVHPKVNDFKPERGIQEGGTRITITGEHLNAGTDITAKFGEQSCIINSYSTTSAVCTTSKHTRTENVSLEMKFDNETVTATNLKFEYTENPNISSFGRGYGYKVGGLNETIRGHHFQAIQRSKMFVEFEGKRYIEACNKISNTQLTCVTPAINPENLRHKRQTLSDNFKLTYGIIMDALEEQSPKKLVIYPDPEFIPFEESWMTTSKFNKKLTIQGRNLLPVLTKYDVKVTIGSQNCIVNFVLSNKDLGVEGDDLDEIQCSLPPLQQGVNDLPINVIVGNNRKSAFLIGNLKYEEIYEDKETLPMWVYIILSASLIMLVVITIFVFVYRRKSRQNVRQVLHKQHHMEEVECEECELK